MYKITITKQHDNPNFKEQLEEYNRRSRHIQYEVQVPFPEGMLTEKSLEVTLTDEEFAAIKKAVLETM